MWGLTPAEWISILRTVAVLVFLEGLLSADNALVLAVMVRHLPKGQQKRALRYGIWGAFFFRFVAIILATRILDYWQFEVVGGLYLLWLCVSHLLSGDHDADPEAKARPGRGFWGTVIGVELADIAFSIDSILAAVALADEMPEHLHHKMLGPFSYKDWTIYFGGVIGIVAMRFVAGYFLKLLDRFKGLALGAYILVGWIGLKLIGEGFHHALVRGDRRLTGGWPAGWREAVPDAVAHHLEMPGWLFWGGMIAIIATSMLYRPKSKQKQQVATETRGLVEIAKIEDRPPAAG